MWVSVSPYKVMFPSRFQVQLIMVPSGSVEVVLNMIGVFVVRGGDGWVVKEAVGGTFRMVMSWEVVCVVSMLSVTVRRIV